jgi:peptidoglycan-N-acetylglucosamine deacetylase
MDIQKKTVTGIMLLMLVLQANAQNGDIQKWNHKQCAVALTYDDGLNVHLDKVIPVLDSLGFKGTFYIPGNSSSLNKRLAEWRSIASHGHELGNHTLFHPCIGKSKGRDWVKAEYDLDNYTIDQIIDEIKLANTLLNALDGKTKRTFAYTCGDQVIGDSSFVELIKNDFVAARGVIPGMNQMNDVNLFDIKAFMVDGQSGDDLIALVERAKKNSVLIVFLFHGVGGEHPINVPVEAHNKLLSYLKKNEKDIWIAPLVEISENIIEYKKRSTNSNAFEK